MHKKTLALTVSGLMVSALSASNAAQSHENPFAFTEIGQSHLLKMADNPYNEYPEDNQDNSEFSPIMMPEQDEGDPNNAPYNVPEGQCGANMYPDNLEPPQESNEGQ